MKTENQDKTIFHLIYLTINYYPMKNDVRLKMVFDSLLNPKYRWSFHVIFWLIVFAQDIDTLLTYEDSDTLSIITIFLVEMVIVYFNIYFLFPKYLLKGKLIRYIIIISALIGLYSLLNYYMFFCDECASVLVENKETGETHEHIESVLSPFIAFTFRMFSIIGTTLGIKFFKYYFLEQKKIQELKQDNLENELLYLKNQINPHFLFNSLNNIYILSKKSKTETSESILLLSDLLRYQLYDCSKDKVLLKNEIDYLHNFFKLEELRKANSKIDFVIEGSPNGIVIAPFLFIPFVENSVKFGMHAKNPEIKLTFTIDHNSLTFNIFNNKPELINENLKGGIGIKNVKRRLHLIYPNKHTLEIHETKETYNVNLKIEF